MRIFKQFLSASGTGILYPIWPGIVVAILLLSACNLPFGGGLQADETNAWIDYPLNESELSLGPVEVVFHVADLSGINQFELLANDTLVASDSPPDSSAPIVTIRLIWQPPGPGEYLLQARGHSQSGGWSDYARVLVTVGNSAEPPPAITETASSTATTTVTSQPACMNNVEFVADVSIPDDSVLLPGQLFTKTWRFRNVGTCIWGTGYALVFVGGVQMGAPGSQSLAEDIPPGKTVDLSVNLAAPLSDGGHRGEFMLQEPGGEMFGLGEDGATAFWVQIIVASTTATPMPTPTSLPDTQDPSVSISHSPSGAQEPNEDQIVTFTATASDNVGVAKIDIWINPPLGGGLQLVKSCTNTTVCVYDGGPYFSSGNLTYRADAEDTAGNGVSTFPVTIFIWDTPD